MGHEMTDYEAARAKMVENQIRTIALTRKNTLFAGHEVGAKNGAMLASLVAT